MKHGFLAVAEAEYMDAIHFYEERQRGLGEALIEEFEKCVSLVIERPNAWRIVHPSGIRRIGLDRFPFSIFFRVNSGVIQILAVAHHRRRPGYWLRRITSSS